jgi:hypothetical protein
MALFPTSDSVDNISVQGPGGVARPAAGLSFDSETQDLLIRDPVTQEIVRAATARKMIKVDIIHPAGAAVETDAFILADRSIVTQMYLNVITPEVSGNTKLLHVGLKASEGGDSQGFATFSVATAGVYIPRLDTQTIATYFKDTASISGGPGSETSHSQAPYQTVSNAARTVTYTAASNNFAELVAELWIEVVLFSGL